MKMKINYIAQINPFKHSGGGELICRDLIDAGRARGHDITLTCAYPDVEYDIQDGADLYFLADVYNQPSAKHRVDSALVREVVSRRPFIHLDNAYVDVCDLPYLPCDGDSDGRRCPFKNSVRMHNRRMFRRHSCFARTSRTMYELSLLNVFLSPLHYRTIAGVIGAGAVGDHFILRPTVDTSLFRDEKRQRDIENLFVGAITEAKGIENMKQLFPGGDVVVIGPRGLGADDSFGYQVGRVDYKDIPTYMNRAENFVFLPRWPEPMGRVVVEAALCGCNLLTNDNVGATSFEFDISDPRNLAGASGEFWDKVELTASRKTEVA